MFSGFLKFGIAGIISGLLSLVATGGLILGGFLLVSHYFTDWVNVSASNAWGTLAGSAVLYVVAGGIALLGFNSVVNSMDNDFKRIPSHPSAPGGYGSW